MAFIRSVAAGLLLVAHAAAQFPPTPEGMTVVNSKYNSGVTISYKENGICETTQGVKSISGYVHLPVGELADVGVTQTEAVNTFFWFFESRKDPKNSPLR